MQLFQLTLETYKKCLFKAWKGFKRNWYWSFLPIAYLLVIALLAPVVGGLGMVGGFVLGLLLAIALSNYLFFVEAGVRNEKVLFSEIWPQTLGLFQPVISVLFGFWIANMLLGMFLKGSPFLLAVVNLLAVILLNPLPEAIYAHRGAFTSTVVESFEFVKENWLEWFLPLIVVLLPSILSSPEAFLLSLANAHPAYLPQLFVMELSTYILISLPITFFIMIFRGLLFQELRGSTRRSRMFKLRMGE